MVVVVEIQLYRGCVGRFSTTSPFLNTRAVDSDLSSLVLEAQASPTNPAEYLSSRVSWT